MLIAAGIPAAGGASPALAAGGLDVALWGTAALLMVLTTVVIVLVWTRSLTVGRLLVLGGLMGLGLAGYVVEGRYGLASRAVSELSGLMRSGRQRPEPVVRRDTSSVDPARRRYRRSQAVFRRQARRRRERRRRQQRRRRRSSYDPQPSPEENRPRRVLGRAEGRGDARTQVLRVPVEWVLEWELPPETETFTLRVMEGEQTLHTLEKPADRSTGSSGPLSPGRYHFEVASDGAWNLRVVQAAP